MDYLPSRKPTPQALSRSLIEPAQRTARAQTGLGDGALTSGPAPHARPRSALYPWLVFLPTLAFCATVVACLDSALIGLPLAAGLLAAGLLAHNLGALLACVSHRFPGTDLPLQVARVAVPLLGASALVLYCLMSLRPDIGNGWHRLSPFLASTAVQAVFGWGVLLAICHKVSQSMRGTAWLAALRAIGSFLLAVMYVGSVLQWVPLSGSGSEVTLLLAAGTAIMFFWAGTSVALPIQILTVAYLLFYRDSNGDLRRMADGIVLVLYLALTLCLPVLAGWYIFGRKKRAAP